MCICVCVCSKGTCLPSGLVSCCCCLTGRCVHAASCWACLQAVPLWLTESTCAHASPERNPLKVVLSDPELLTWTEMKKPYYETMWWIIKPEARPKMQGTEKWCVQVSKHEFIKGKQKGLETPGVRMNHNRFIQARAGKQLSETKKRGNTRTRGVVLETAQTMLCRRIQHWREATASLWKGADG